ncbi:hypothetical protein NG797_03715 [Laspinema sp. D5]|nr:hypothetical protein [Laspinema sp. D3d]
MIVIPSKSDTLRSTLVDSTRIMAWTLYKSQNKLTGSDAFEGYKTFEEQWKEHEIHSMDLKKVQKYIKDLGYTEQELLQQRSQYYERKHQQNQKATPQNPKFVEAPSPFDNVNAPEFDDEFEYPEPPY